MSKLIFASGLLVYFICTCTIKKVNIHTYIHPGYISGQIHSIAFLSVRESQVKELESRRMNTRVFHAFLDKNPHIEILSQSKSTSLINGNHLSDTWTAFLENYELYGRPDVELLGTIGSTLNIDGIMQGEIVELTQIEGEVGLNRATTEVKIRYRLFDTFRGRLVWEAVSDGIKIAATDTEPLPPVWDVLKIATEKLLYYLPSL